MLIPLPSLICICRAVTGVKGPVQGQGQLFEAASAAAGSMKTTSVSMIAKSVENNLFFIIQPPLNFI
jgi:hypothetical protein